jgi:hypothetical protein
VKAVDAPSTLSTLAHCHVPLAAMLGHRASTCAAPLAKSSTDVSAHDPSVPAASAPGRCRAVRPGRSSPSSSTPNHRTG